MSRNTEETQRGDVAKGNERPEWSDGGKWRGTNTLNKRCWKEGGGGRERQRKSQPTRKVK